MEAKDRIILALDVSNPKEAGALINKLRPYVGIFKIGPILLQPLLHKGQWVEFLKKASGTEISLFIDEKLCHSPEVLKNTVDYYNFPPIKMFTVQASCGRDSLKAAVAKKGITIPADTKILISTVLTSMSRDECWHVYGKWPEQKVVEFAFDAFETACDGIVCSSRELRALAQHKELIELGRYVAGIRPPWWQRTTDQIRIDTPFGAIKAGADYLIIGRPILKPPPQIGSPIKAVKRILEEIEEAQKERVY